MRQYESTEADSFFLKIEHQKCLDDVDGFDMAIDDNLLNPSEKQGYVVVSIGSSVCIG